MVEAAKTQALGSDDANKHNNLMNMALVSHGRAQRSSSRRGMSLVISPIY
jgi:hypothetical protein